MCHFLVFISFSLVSLVAVVSAANDIGLERIIIQLRSRVNSDSSQLNSNIEALTTKYLNDYYGAYYSKNYHQDGYFLHTTLAAKSLGIHGIEGSFITTIEIDGSLSFDPDMEAPSGPFVDTLLRNAFQGHNEKIYLNNLLSTSNSNSNFLHHMTHIIIEINGLTVAETEISRNNDDPSTGQDVNSNTTGFTSPFVPDAQEDNGQWPIDEKWMKITIFLFAGVVGTLLLIGCCCFVRCLFCHNSRNVVVDEEEDILGEEPIKILALPVKRCNTTPTSQSNTEESDSCSLDEQMGCSPPSPVHSLASQDSSMFTYSNNNHTSKLNTSRISLGSFSKFSMDMQASIDLGGATHQSSYRPNTITNGTTVPPFGHDISAIENYRDLSLIQEEDDDEEMGHHHLERARSKSGGRASRKDHQYISSTRRSIGHRVYNGRHSKSSSRSRHCQATSSSHRFSFGRRHEDFDTLESSIDLDASSSDVIADLRNLSLQIEKQRKGRRAPDPR
ncbi:hypothetical protein IV203_004169 [Nitzschia inconspicua]|uniref:Uncharacterized protein n=1 Tax=Nitzschia inconspicua TaxID=303405 RepID=A0A9K3L557_9STRA|nr:hypothetical protein IV203_004169 [Nitzschia inconspicua]